MDNPVQEHSSPSNLRQVLSRSSRSKTTPSDLESRTSSGRSDGRSSIESTLDKSRPKTSTSVGQDDSIKSGASGISRLLPNRRRKKKHQVSQMSVGSGSGEITHQSQEDIHASTSSINGSLRTKEQSEESNGFLTDDSDPEKATPLTLKTSHAGYLTASPPLITTTMIDRDEADVLQSYRGFTARLDHPSTSETFPDLMENPSSNRAGPDGNAKESAVPSKPKDPFTAQGTSSRSVSPDRSSSISSGSGRQNLLGNINKGISQPKGQAGMRSDSSPPLALKPIRVNAMMEMMNDRTLEDSAKSLPIMTLPTIMTTVTPPSPTEPRSGFDRQPSSLGVAASLEPVKKIPDNLPPGTVVSHSGNMISHRRVRSTSSTLPPSKLSQSMTTQLAATPEEPRALTTKIPGVQQTGFFSSMFSAAQNAASTISSSLNGQSRIRSTVQMSDTEVQPETNTNVVDVPSSAPENEPEDRKELAVDTLGSGDLSFSHLEIDASTGNIVTTKDGVVITKPDLPLNSGKSMTVLQRDELSSRIEDIRAARAVSMAYEKPNDASSTPPIVDDPVELHTSHQKEGSGQISPSESVFETETGSTIKRTSSGHSRLAQRSPRRHRGSSGATNSTMGGAFATSTVSLGLTGTSNMNFTRPTGFAVASKKRNRDFHQLFRSVPEDDYLIEDYSCALQREIILAGRIYISEGHICFSSNILGWVTTLVISFDEIVAIEKETTAMVFPNAIAIQTLHARHTFRSLLSRESTYELMVNIWRINHPALKSCLNGTRIDQGMGDKTKKTNDSDEASNASEEEDEVYDEDEDGPGDTSFADVVGGCDAENELPDSAKAISSKPPAFGSSDVGAASLAAYITSISENKTGDRTGGDAASDFPGPATHSPTEFNDPSGRYEKVVKDDIIPAPLGKVYSLIFGPASGSFITRFLIDEAKCMELRLEDDKKGLTTDNRTRQYSYIKPLNGSIGLRQTKCISTETLDVLDLDKAVLVTLSTQTPDVPSGNVFLTKTKYLLTWAPGNQTRFFMSCSIEWMGKSWLKGPIEKGAIDGQTAFGTDIVKALKAAVAPRRPHDASRSSKAGKGRRKNGVSGSSEEAATAAAFGVTASLEASRESKSWGIFEPLHRPLSSILNVFPPFRSTNLAFGIIGILSFTVIFQSLVLPPVVSPGIGYPGLTTPQRIAAYEEMWRREESELWGWLEERIGMEGLLFPGIDQLSVPQARHHEQRRKNRARALNVVLDEESMAEREINYAIKVTRERLEALEDVIQKRKPHSAVDSQTSPANGDRNGESVEISMQ